MIRESSIVPPELNPFQKLTAEVKDRSPEFVWSDEQPLVVGYDVALGTKPGMADIVDWTFISKKSHAFSGLNLTPHNRAYFSLRAVDQEGMRSDSVSSGNVLPIGLTEQKIIPPHRNGYAFFGTNVAVDERSIVVSQPRTVDRQGFRNGEVYTYELNPEGEWQLKSTLQSPEGFGGRYHFGSSLSLSSGTLFVGAPDGRHDGVDHDGSVFVFQANRRW